MNKVIKGFKFVTTDLKSKNGNHTWKLNKWYKYGGDLEICKKGFHACLTPQQSLNYIYGDKWFIVEAGGEIIHEKNDKFVASEMRLIKEIKPEESTKILKKYAKKTDYQKLEKDLGDIPTKKDVIILRKEIDKINWFKPQEPNKVKINLKIKSILKAFNIKGGCEIQLNPLRKKEDWDSARDSAWDSVRVSAWVSARDSARALEFELVKDLMKKKGYKNNPFRELLGLWKMGLYPIGILKDKKFHIYYVPLENNK